MKTNFNTYNFFYKMLNEEDEVENPNQQQEQPQQEDPNQQQEQPQQNPGGSVQEQAFRGLQGQVIGGIQYSPNGANGGVLKIKVKNSYVPFTISWVNQTVTVTDLEGNTISLSETQ